MVIKMAHYAFIDKNNIVTQVIIGKNENENNIDWEIHYSEVMGQLCKRTSYNTVKGKHLENGIPFRKNYAGIGYTYDQQRDAFIPPKPFESWVLDEETCDWNAPIQHPNDGKRYSWNEKTTSWVEMVVS